MMNAHWFSLPMESSGAMLIMILGGVVLAVAGIFSYINGDTLNTALFLVFGALLFSFALTSMAASNLSQTGLYSSFSGWVYVLFAIFIFYLWMGSYGGSTARSLFLFGLWLTLLALAIANWSSSAGLEVVSGYLGLVTSVIAGYVSAAGIIDFSTVRRTSATGEAAMGHQ
jgi:uncharacterized protein